MYMNVSCAIDRDSSAFRRLFFFFFFLLAKKKAVGRQSNLEILVLMKIRASEDKHGRYHPVFEDILYIFILCHPH